MNANPTVPAYGIHSEQNYESLETRLHWVRTDIGEYYETIATVKGVRATDRKVFYGAWLVDGTRVAGEFPSIRKAAQAAAEAYFARA